MNSHFEIGGYGQPAHAAEVRQVAAAPAAVERDPGEALQRREHDIDIALEDSFPASDPPCWTMGRPAR